MKIFTMGFTKKTAKQFFDKIKDYNIQILIDIRLNNRSQLAGFTKGTDLEFFLKEICQCEYVHVDYYAPTDEILSAYKKKKITWNEYEKFYNDLICNRGVAGDFKNKFGEYDRVLLLCSEPTPENCHRRILAEHIQGKLGYEILHI